MSANDALKFIKDNDAQFVDFRFTDPKGKWQHTSYIADKVNEGSFEDGIMFDGSSIAGWKSINESDMILMPEPKTAFLDPFAAQPTLVIFCDVIEPATGQPYSRDPRSCAKRAEAFLQYTNLGDTAYFGPELEFFVFDDVRFKVGMNEAFYSLDSEESPQNTSKMYESGNMGHRPGVKGGYFPVQPIDSLSDM